MKTLFKFLFSIIIACVLLIVFFVVSLHFAPADQLKPILLKSFNQITHQKLAVDGSMIIRVLPQPHLVLEQVHLDTKLEDLNLNLHADKATVNFPWHIFWDSNITFDDVELEKFKIVAKSNKAVIYEDHFDNIQARGIDTKPQFKIKSLSVKQRDNEAQGQLSIRPLKVGNQLTCKAQVKHWTVSANPQFYAVLELFKKTDCEITANTLNIDKLKLIDSKLNVAYQQGEGTLKLSTKLEAPEVVTQASTLKIKDKRFVSADGDFKLKYHSQDYVGKYELRPLKEDNSYQMKVASFVDEGTLNAAFEFDLKNNTLKTDLQLTQANASQVLNRIKPNTSTAGGVIDLQLKGQSQGLSLSAALSSFTGNALVHIKDMSLLNKRIDTRYVDMFALLFKKFARSDNTTQLQCIALRAKINQGRFDFRDNLGIETRDLIMAGGGVFHYPSQQLVVNLQLKPRSEANLEIGAFTNNIAIQGPLDNLNISGSKGAILHEGTTLALGVATGGISLLAEKLFKIVAKNQSPCKTVMQGAPTFAPTPS